MTILDALNWRYAAKRFSRQPIPEAQRDGLIEAVRLTPSCYGLQPWRLIQVNSHEQRKALVEHAYGQDKVLECSDLFVIAASTAPAEAMIDRYLARQAETLGQPLAELADFRQYLLDWFAALDHTPLEWAHRQAYLALGNLTTSAAVMGIDACPMEGIERAGFDQVLGLAPLQLTTTAACPIGYRHPEDGRARSPKVRFEPADFLLAM